MTQLEAEQYAQSVASAVHRVVELAKIYPSFIREEVATLSNASDDLADLVAKCQMRDAAE